MISTSNGCAARVSFEVTSMISDQNSTTQSSITALLHSFSVKAQNSVAQIQEFSVSLHKYLIDPVLSWFVKSRKSCLSFS